MDHPERLAARLRQFALQSDACRGGTNSDATLRTWLQFWNDEDSDAGNRRNFEHWLNCAAVAESNT
jgi:hypothetical protein